MKWIRVTKGNPCPVCGHSKWCMISSDGAVCRCKHTSEGSYKTVEGQDGPGYYHRLSGDIKPPSVQPEIKPLTNDELNAIHRECQAVINESQLDELAGQLKVKTETLKRFKVGYSVANFAFCIPEVDHTGQLKGLQYRHETSGKKWCERGSKRGLYIPDDLTSGALLVCEGFSDTAAALDMGFSAIGRNNCSDHSPDLIMFLKQRSNNDKIVVVADSDKQGFNGAEKLADELLNYNLRANVLLLPPNFHDLREWYNSGGNRESVQELIDATPYYISKSSYQGTPVESSDLRANGYGLTEAETGRRFSDTYGNSLKHNTETNTWYFYDGIKWNSRLGWDVAKQKIKELARIIRQEGELEPDQSKREARIRLGLNLEKRYYASNTLWQANSEPPCNLLLSDLDQNKSLFNCQNLTLDLSDPTNGSQLERAHSPSDLISKVAPTICVKGAACNLWRECLDKWQPIKENQEFLQRHAGMCLEGGSARVLLILWGGGRNGKSVYCNALVQMFGDYGKIAHKGFLGLKRYEEHPTGIAGLEGFRLVITSERNERQKLDLEIVKLLTGDASVEARKMKQDFRTIKIDCKLILMCQHLPIIEDATTSIWDRVKLLGWQWECPKKEERPLDEMLARLAEERAGILQWCLEGYRQYRALGCKLNPPADVVSATAQYRNEQNSIRAFVEDKTLRVHGCEVPAENVWEAYEIYCDDREYPALSKRQFNQTLLDERFQRIRKNTSEGKIYFWKNLQLINDEV